MLRHAVDRKGRRLNAAAFIAKWSRAELKERSAAQEHFLDLCHLLGHPSPAEADPTGQAYGFEIGADKHGGGEGFADVWKKDFFGWEYKGRRKDLDAAYDQLLLYRDALANPPLLVTCDLDRIVVHTNFTGTVSVTHEITLERLGEPRSLEILHAVFFDPDKLRPGKTSEAITQEAARQFADIAQSMRKRGVDPAAVAHFLDRVVFCLFAEDIGLLPDLIFTRIVEKAGGDPARFGRLIGQLFQAMSAGGEFGLETIRHFNGSLFNEVGSPDLISEEVERIVETARLDWSAVDPSIFGTLFERGLDPDKRSQLGAHFTGRADIELLVDAVVMQPLRQEWAEARQTVGQLLATGRKSPGGSAPAKPLGPPAQRKARGEAESLAHRFLTRLQSVKVLDPACGSGNFLYVTLHKLKDLEKEVILYAMDNGLGSFLPMAGPWQLYGIELNPYAHDLAQMTVWIGWLQWIKFNGFGTPQDPVLRSLSGNFQCRDAILNPDGTEPEWPKVDYIVGNPPFLGDKLMRRELGDDYVDRLRLLYADRIPGQSDLCCYWFERARAQIAVSQCKRAGLLATQGIRGGANREVLKRIKDSGDIFWAESDRPWILNGANVHVSMVGFDDGAENIRILDAKSVATINVNLSAAADLASAAKLLTNEDSGFIGVSMHGPFDLPEEDARAFLDPAGNPTGRPNSDVVRPILNAMEITKREASRWIIAFPPNLAQSAAALYQDPFDMVMKMVKPIRDKNNRKVYREHWWLHGEPRPAMLSALVPLPRFLATPRVSKHRVFVWCAPEVVPSDATVAFARSDDYFFGVLHSRFHEIWSLKLGTRLETRPRYTPTTCFETFPFPKASPEQEAAIASAAQRLNELRENWLNPPEWVQEEVLEFPGTVGGPWDRYILKPDTRNLKPGDIATVRYVRPAPRDAACEARLKARTLTKLYNERPTWLADLHARLDTAVAAAYGWPADLPDEAILERLLALNQASG